MQETTNNHWLEHIKLKMTIWSTHCNYNMVSNDLKYMNHDTNSEISSHHKIQIVILLQVIETVCQSVFQKS